MVTMPAVTSGATERPPTDHPMWETQLALEDRMFHEGVEAYRRRLQESAADGRASSVGPARRLMQAAVDPTSRAVRQFFDDASSGKPGPRNAAARMLVGADADVLAFITVGVTLDLLLQLGGRTYQFVSSQIGAAVEDEMNYVNFAKAFSKELARIEKEVQGRTSNSTYIRRRLTIEMGRREFERLDWGPKKRFAVGAKLLDLFSTATGLVELRRVGRDNYIDLQEEARSWIVEAAAEEEGLFPRLMPCVVPPKPWTGLYGGGYWTGKVRTQSLVRPRARQGGRNITAHLKGRQFPKVVEALNAIQSTPWRVNKRVLGVQKELWERGADLPVLPLRDDPELPAKPEDIDVNEEARLAYRKEAHKVYLERASLTSTRRAWMRTLSLAEDMAHYPAIYFPHHLDFRGRAYATVPFLTPQGNDQSKGLLEFAEGKPLGTQEAADWLMIHVANCWGVDKVSFANRLEWVRAHATELCWCAVDPLTNRFWMDADSPWCALAAAIEFEGFMRNGLAHVSHIPIAMDGSCNGLQHYSAMLRDPIGGEAVNLIASPDGKPQDIYARVAEVVVAHLKKNLGKEGHQYASAWLAFGIDRKVTKRPVMVLPYGGTFASTREYVQDAVREGWAAGKPRPFTDEEEENKAIVYLAQLVWNSIGDVVVAAREAMSWLRSVAGVASRAGLPITWTTPMGFPVLQLYGRDSTSVVKTRYRGNLVQSNISTFTPEPNRQRQQSALPPNFVHSLDAAALQATVLRAKANGLDAFAMIHDSYGTRASDTPMLAKLLREAFVEMYEDQCPLERLAEEMQSRLPPGFPEAIPPVPTKGSLNIKSVLDSPYFFA